MPETDNRTKQSVLPDVRGSKLNIHRMGEGEPLLFLHGAQGLSGNEPGLDALASHFDVIAPDHPGFGRSEDSELVDDVRDLALFYLDLLDELALEQVHVVGHCIGGWVALEMAVASSGRFNSLVLVNSAGIRLKGVPRGDMFLSSEDDLLKLLFAHDGAEWLKRWRATPELEEIYDRNRAAAAKLSWSPRLCNPKLDRWLHRIDVPTHIIHQRGVFRGAEAGMVGGNDIETAGERGEPRLSSIESLGAMQKQQRLALAHAMDIELAAPHGEEPVLLRPVIGFGHGSR